MHNITFTMSHQVWSFCSELYTTERNEKNTILTLQYKKYAHCFENSSLAGRRYYVGT